MDTSDLTLIEHVLQAARRLGLDADLILPKTKRKTDRSDARMRLAYGGRRVDYAVEAKRALTPATLGAVLHQHAALPAPALLVTEYTTPPVAERLREARVEFIDAAGNAYLNQPPLLIWVKGERPPEKIVPPEVGRAFQPGGLQVLFALLCDSAALNQPYRELARRAGVAHGTVGWVMADLQRMGFVRDIPGKRGTRRLYDGARLLAQWTEAYARQLRPRLLLGRYYVETVDGWETWPLLPYGALWGGEPAAARATGYLRPGELTLYAPKLPTLLAAKQRFTLTPEPGRTAVVEVRRRFWEFSGDPTLPELVPPLLIYADLLATGDGRCIETANLIHEQYLARLFDQA